jgi:Ca-activated chloride channel family protein
MRRFVQAGIVFAALLHAQDELAIHVDVKLVNVAFTARDANGRLVADLTRDDIEVLDDGAPQPISFFAHSADLPLALGLIADASGSQESFLKRHHRDLDTFLKNTLTPRDQAFLVCFGNQVRLVSDFSSRRELLMERLKDFDKDQRLGPYPELGPAERRILGTAFYDALYYATSQKLERSERGRRALIVFSDGEDNSSAHHMLDATEAAQSADTAIYGIRYTDIDKRGMNGRNKYGISVMSRIARDTGGRDFDAQKTDMKEAFGEIEQELRSSYELAYHSPNADGTFHKLVVRSKRPGILIRAKTGYFARNGS